MISDDPNLRALRRHFETRPVILYTGAGVSRSTEAGVGVGSWDELLRSLVSQELGESKAQAYDVDVSASDPWRRADWIAAHLGRDRLRDAIHDRVRAPGVFQRVYTGLLQRGFVRSTPTLRAVAAFSVALIGYSTGRRDGATVWYARVAPNPRVPAILTTNYDPYLEAAASSMFRTLIGTHPLKPVAAIGSTAGLLGQTPVFHVHGYVPPRPDLEHTSFVDPVLTTSDYAAAWRNSARSYTIGPQLHLLRHYSALFIGCSFRDRWVNGLLRTINAERTRAAALGGTRLHHYALVSSAEIASLGAGWFDRLGVRPIGWHHASEIPDALADLYLAGVEHDLRCTGALTLHEYTPVRPNGSQPSGHAVTITDPDTLPYVWRNLEQSWHNPLDSPPPGHRHPTRP